MRRIQLALAGLVLSATLVGCGQAGAPTGAMRTTTLAPSARALGPTLKPEALELDSAAAILSNNSAGLNAPASLDPVKAVSDPRYAADHAEAIGQASAQEDQQNAAQEAASNPPSYKVDDRTPYGVVVTERTATTMTIAWRTELPTKGLVEYGKTGSFKKNGFSGSFRDDVAKTDHKITLTKLSRYTQYTFKVTAVTALGLKFPEQERTARTKFWALR